MVIRNFGRIVDQALIGFLANDSSTMVTLIPHIEWLTAINGRFHLACERRHFNEDGRRFGYSDTPRMQPDHLLLVSIGTPSSAARILGDIIRSEHRSDLPVIDDEFERDDSSE